MTDLCFAYGSNTNLAAWRNWCLDRGYDPNCIEPVGPARLPDMSLVFNYYSPGWDGGALNVRRRIGGFIDGLLFRASPRGWAALDAKEGVRGGYYERVPRTVVLPDGEATAAIVYEVCVPRRAGFVRPAEAYLDIVRQGFAEQGFDTAPLEAAAQGGDGCHVLADVFAYGTLMRDELRHGCAEALGLHSVTPAETFGRLYDLGEYPALSLGSPAAAVKGELLRFKEIERALTGLDAIEDARSGCAPGGLYRRTIITATGQADQPVSAWAYVMETAQVADVPMIKAGDWRHSASSRAE